MTLRDATRFRAQEDRLPEYIRKRLPCTRKKTMAGVRNPSRGRSFRSGCRSCRCVADSGAASLRIGNGRTPSWQPILACRVSGQACIAHRVRTSVRSSDALPGKLDMGFAWAAHLAQMLVDDRGDGPRELDWHCLPYHAVLLAR